jgi:Skp family chaperone for outer membrane proteins
MRDRATNNKNNAEADANQVKSDGNKPVGKSSELATASKTTAPLKDGPSESGSLNKFRETIKDVLEEITVLEVNTMIVSHIPIARFDAKEFYTDLLENIIYKTEEGLQDIKRALLDRSKELQQKGSAATQTELDRYNQDLEIYKRAERTFKNRQNLSDPRQKEQFEVEQACYEELAKKVLQMDVPKDIDGNLIPDAPTIRHFRKLWEFEQSILNGERIYAQTKFQLDGDLNNRFLDDLFISTRSKIDPKMAKLVFDLHHQAVENAEKQWTGLITTCVNLVKDLMPFRSK